MFSLIATEDDVHTELWATCADIDGFFRSPGTPTGERRIELVDASVSGALREYCCNTGRGVKVGSAAALQVLGPVGQVIGEYYLRVLACETCIPRRAVPEKDTGARYDVTLDIRAEDESPYLKEVWKRWHNGMPRAKNLWAEYPREGRAAWLQVVRNHHTHVGSGSPRDLFPGGNFELDGRYVTDDAAFYCAIGEAVNGPGGYFGAGLDALEDCLLGGFGARAPFTLVWRDFATAVRHLEKPLYGAGSLRGELPQDYYDSPEGVDSIVTFDDIQSDENLTRPYLDRILEILAGKGVAIIRA